MTRWSVLHALLLAAAAGLVPWACYKTTAPPPKCINLDNCGNPADYPPLNDDRTVFKTGPKDAGR